MSAVMGFCGVSLMLLLMVAGLSIDIILLAMKDVVGHHSG